MSKTQSYESYSFLEFITTPENPDFSYMFKSFTGSIILSRSFIKSRLDISPVSAAIQNDESMYDSIKHQIELLWE